MSQNPDENELHLSEVSPEHLDRIEVALDRLIADRRRTEWERRQDAFDAFFYARRSLIPRWS